MTAARISGDVRPAAPQAGHRDALRLERIAKSYGRHRALIDVSLTFTPGKVAAVLGPNGAGKSTMLGILSTLVQPSSGQVAWGAEVLGRASPLRARIGYVGHEPGLYGDLTASENLRLFCGLYNLPDPVARTAALLERVGLGDVSRDAVVRTFSRGMQQRLSLARALLPEPDLLLFDEPGSALDPAGAAWLTAEIAQEQAAGRIVVLVTHDLDAAAAVAEQIVVLRRGRVVCDEMFAGTPGGHISPAQLRGLYEEKTRV
jgi:heme exporter protein A